MKRFLHIFIAIIAAALLPAIFVVIFQPRERHGIPQYKTLSSQVYAPLEDWSNPLRQRRWLDGRWHFRLAGEKTWRAVSVPHVWNLMPGLEDYVGEAEYRRQFSVPAHWEGRRVLLRFEGVARRASVTVNGRPVGTITAGGMPQPLDITDSLNFKSRNLLEAEVSNEGGGLDPAGRAVKNYGGIFREVYIETRGDAFVVSLDPRIEKLTEREALVNVRATVAMPTSGEVSVLGEIRDPEGRRIDAFEDSVTLRAGEPSLIQWDVKIKNPSLWWPRTPGMYTAKLLVLSPGLQTDGMTAAFGLRTFDTAVGRFRLNGQPMYLRGVDRVADSSAAGPVETLDAMKQDIRLARAAGFNAIRMAFAPPHRRFLDLCDEAGMFVLEEIPLYAAAPGSLYDKAAAKAAHDNLARMITRDARHPSVIMWGIGSGVDVKKPGAAKLIRELTVQARRLDPSRPVYVVPAVFGSALSPDSPASVNLFTGPAPDPLAALVSRIDSISKSSAGQATIAFGIESIGRYGYAPGAGRAGSEQSQLVDAAQKRLAVDTRPELDGDFIHSLADYALPSRIPGRVNLSHTGLLSYNREAKAAYQWIAKYKPADEHSGAGASEVPSPAEASLPATPPALELGLAALFTFFAFVIWSGGGRVMLMLMTPEDAATAGLDAARPAARFLQLGLPAFLASGAALAALAAAAIQRAGWDTVAPLETGWWGPLLAASPAARLCLVYTAQASLLIISSTVTALILRRGIADSFEMHSRCLVPRIMLCLPLMMQRSPEFMLLALIFWEYIMRARAARDLGGLKISVAWFAAAAGPAVSIAAAVLAVMAATGRL